MSCSPFSSPPSCPSVCPSVIPLLHSSSIAGLYFSLPPLPPVVRYMSPFSVALRLQPCWHGDQPRWVASLVQLTAPHWIPEYHILLFFFLSALLLNPMPLSCLADCCCTPELRPELLSFPRVLYATSYTFLLSHLPPLHLQPPAPSLFNVLTWIAVSLSKIQLLISVCPPPAMCCSTTATCSWEC